MSDYNDNEYKELIEEGGINLSTGDINYRTIINIQVNDCRNAFRIVPVTKRSVEFARMNVELFESLMVNYKDEGYAQQLKLLIDAHKAKIARFKKEYGDNAYMINKHNLDYNYARKKFELVLKLASRRGFTQMKETTDFIGVKKDSHAERKANRRTY